ncbi:Immune inhibitor A [Pseudocercospora fuligena]|uniref:Immune inhibitor A n=1 Tax=Pseudocercospora fuligena TaxID=685502 RepID=A0A8H6RP17_9PEZI|nr:Immune inhibitor A [Pseudocercospora fuligena]
MAFNDCNHGACFVPPHPELLKKFISEQPEGAERRVQSTLEPRVDKPLGLDDGTLHPPERFAANVPKRIITSEAQREPALRGQINLMVVLVDFADKRMPSDRKGYFRDLFFSTDRKVKTGSVTEYFTEVSGGKITMAGDILGPFTLPKNLTTYANGANGTSSSEPNSRTMAGDAVDAIAKAGIDVSKFDNKIGGRQPGYVDAFILVHAGRGAEETGNKNDLWSVKWVLNRERKIGNTKISAFLTVPEDAKLGVCAHEIGHLIFGWPDLYDISYKTGGVGNWCLMSGGSWGAKPGEAAGTTPCHPSAWCKAQQGWADVVVQKKNGKIVVDEVKNTALNTTSVERYGDIHKLWSNGDQTSREYFLIENRNKTGFDASLPGAGLLIWHIDDTIDGNSNMARPQVGLENANDGTPATTADDLIGVPDSVFPGRFNKRSFGARTNPNSNSHAGRATYVSVANISDPDQIMSMDVTVEPPVLARL